MAIGVSVFKQDRFGVLELVHDTMLTKERQALVDV